VTRARRVLVYAQHLSGVGHHVRIREIAQALARRHRVACVQGGRPVPGPSAEGCEKVELPALARGADGLAPADGSRDLAPVMAARAAALARAARELAPDVLVIEHFPFSKWELEPEIAGLVAAARAANPGLELVCSARDVLRRTRHERASDADWGRRVATALNERFDRLFVHADPAFTKLEEHFAGAGELRLPVEYTGFVSQKLDAPAGERAAGPGTVVVSTGGGAGSAALVERVLEAWARLAARGAHGGRRLRVFAGLFWSEPERARLCASAGALGAELRPFAGDFLANLAQAELSISRAGYNTCTNLLETRCRALLLPDPRMSDQAFRAGRLAEHGLASVVDDPEPAPAALAEAIEAALARPRPRHAFELGGAERTCALLSR
jgi:predicted glycosyltransferase